MRYTDEGQIIIPSSEKKTMKMSERIYSAVQMAQAATQPTSALPKDAPHRSASVAPAPLEPLPALPARPNPSPIAAMGNSQSRMEALANVPAGWPPRSSRGGGEGPLATHLSPPPSPPLSPPSEQPSLDPVPPASLLPLPPPAWKLPSPPPRWL